jgi:hypothetical protein
MGNLRPVLDKMAADKTEVMITLRGDAQRLGPGTVEPYDAIGAAHTIFKITSKSLVQTGPGKPPVEVTVPVIFDAADVSVIIEVPKNIDDEPLVQTPGGGGRRTPGGLHIG